MYTESRLALSAMRIASFLYLRTSAKIRVLMDLFLLIESGYFHPDKRHFVYVVLQ
jgi:hypothetical protein